MSQPYIGQIVGFAGNFAPRGWALCQGQLLPIAQYTALFSILGTTYGGDGRTTFGLPDLQGRAMIEPGTGPGLTAVRAGEKSGAESLHLTEAQLPSHTHTATLHAENKAGTATVPAGNFIGRSGNDDTIFAAPDPAVNVAMGAESVTLAPTGSGSAIPNMKPGLGLNMIIALEGSYPPRS